MVTKRDIKVLSWVADQYAVRLDHVRVLLSRYPGKPIENDLISTSVLKDQIDRWRAAGWVEYKRFLADGPGWIWVTKRGLEMLGLDFKYVARRPAEALLRHYHAINTVRLRLEKYVWHSEREIVSEHPRKKGLSFGPLPDGWIEYPAKDGGILRVAVEVELTQKSPSNLSLKVGNLASSGFYQHTWFYVPSAAMLRAVEVAIAAQLEYQQKRVGVVQFDLEAW